MRYEAYYNLHKQCLSARPIGSRPAAAGIDMRVRHYDWLNMRDVTFAVQPAGRQRVIREKQKNVHAYVRGELDSSQLHTGQPFDEGTWDWYDEVTYNPYKYESFVLKHNEQPIYEAEHAWVIGKRIYVPHV